MNSEKLLSICIPTYNRAETLNNTLKALFNNSEFNEQLIEVVVLDNASTDNTAEIVANYPQVIFWRNDENIQDRTFWKVLNYGTGKYVKLFNDTLTFKGGVLKKMLSVLADSLADADHQNVFFYDNNSFCSNTTITLNNKSTLLKCVSFYTTSIANFGCWRKDLNKIVDPLQYWQYQFLQVDWVYQLVEQKANTAIHFADMFVVNLPPRKGGYNVFNTFVNKYLYVIEQQKFSCLRYEVEKYRLMRYFIWSWVNQLVIHNDERFVFDTKGWLGLLFKKYWYEPYLYPVLILLVYKYLKSR